MLSPGRYSPLGCFTPPAESQEEERTIGTTWHAPQSYLPPAGTEFSVRLGSLSTPQFDATTASEPRQFSESPQEYAHRRGERCISKSVACGLRSFVCAADWPGQHERRPGKPPRSRPSPAPSIPCLRDPQLHYRTDASPCESRSPGPPSAGVHPAYRVRSTQAPFPRASLTPSTQVPRSGSPGAARTQLNRLW